MNTWQLQEAKVYLGDLVKRAGTEGPQQVTVRGRPAAVVLSLEEYQRLQGGRPRFVEFMRSSPLCGVALELERDRSTTRDVELT